MSDFSAARKAMIDSQLRPSGVTDAGVLKAMSITPREDHVPASTRAFAYFDRIIPLDDGRGLMPPVSLGRLLSEIAPRAGERALVYAPATGYAAALLTAIGLDVETVDAGGSAPQGRYDVILVDGAVPALPASLAGALTEGGRIGVAIAERGIARLAIGTKSGGDFGLRKFADAAVPLIPGMTQPAGFAF